MSCAVRMADAASSFLASLDTHQRETAQWPFPSDHERRLWFYTPTDHGGVTLGDLRPAQRRLAMALLDSGLSRPAYVTASTVLGLENVLDQLEGFTASWGWERGRDPQRYFVRIFGEPGSEAWGWRFGGHHVSVNHTVLNGELAAGTPLFLGADPASSPLLGGQLLRPLGACEDIARELLRSLDGRQRDFAVVSAVPPVDLVGANRSELSDGDGPLPLAHVWRNEFTGELARTVARIQDTEEAKIGLMDEHVDSVRYRTVPIGLAAADMTEAQRSMLRGLLDTYVGRLPDDAAERFWAQVDRHFESVHFAWAGSLEPGLPHYYRLHGPRLLAEYDNTTRDGNHVHTVLRDPVDDFGVDSLGTHRRSAH
ncbi:MAG: hypothetical protein RI912_1257 [Actinomycetota bacterium]